MNLIAACMCSAPVLCAFLGTSHSALGQNQAEPRFPAGIQLPAQARGEAAIAALGKRLPEVAAFHAKSPQRLRELFRADNSLWVNPEGELFYACELGCTDFAQADTSAQADVIAESIGTTDPSPFNTTEAFLLHSRPGANRVIHLDFDGHVDNTPGNWKDGASAPPFDTNGDPSTFTTSERERIIYIWQRVSEDFSMYEIDVTTEDPGVEALRKSNSSDLQYGIRVCIGGKSGGSNWYANSVGGVAYVGSFDAGNDLPCWVFPGNLGNSEKNIAEAASHEAGHTLGLSHDGVTGGASYYGGQGKWAPIMGVGYSKPISQWSKGEYANANQLQDDLAIMLTQGAVYRTDDHGNSIATATELVAVSGTASITGVIEKTTDLDYFSFTAGGGSTTISVARPPRDSNLHMQVKLYNAGGTVIYTNTPADTTTGTASATNTVSLAAGTYYLSVDGVGTGDPLTTGYSDYSSLGQYAVTVSGTAPVGPSWQPVLAGSYSWPSPANWSTAPPDAAGITALVNNDITGNQFINLTTPVTIGTLILGDADGSHGFTVQSTGGSLTFNNASSPAVLSKETGANDVISTPVVLAGNLEITHSSDAKLTLSGAIGGAGSLTKSGTGTTVLNTVNNYTGSTLISNGVLRLDDVNALPAGNLNLTGGVLGLASGDFTGRTVGTGASQVRWTDDGGFAAYGATRAVKFTTSSLNWTSAAFIGSGNVLILGAQDADATLDWQQSISFAGGERIIQVIDGSAAIDAIISGNVAGGSTGTYSNHFVKSGGGTLAMIAQPSYWGDTTVSEGTLMLGDGTSNTGGVSSNSTSISMSGGATLAVNRTGPLTQGGSALPAVVSGEGDFAQGGSGTTVFTLANTYSGITSISNGTLQLGDGTSGNDGTIADCPTVINNGSLVYNRFGNSAYSGVIGGSGTVTKTGAGTQTLLNTNIYTGLTTISNGTLALGDGVTSNGAVAGDINNDAELVIANPLAQTYGGIISGTGNLTKSGPGVLTLSGVNTFSGTATIAAGTLAFNQTAPLDNCSGITMAGGALLRSGLDGAVIHAPITIGTSGTNVTISAPTNAPGGGVVSTLTLNGTIGGAGDITFSSSVNQNALSTVYLGAPSTYSGSTLIDTATAGSTATQTIVKLGIDNALPVTTVVTMDGQTGVGSGRFTEINLNGFNQELAGLRNIVRATNRRQRVVNSDAAAAATLTIRNSSDCTFTGYFGGGGGSVSGGSTPGSTNGDNFSLVKEGSATFTLGVNASAGGLSYAGDTTVNEGILSLGRTNNSNDLSTVTIAASGATLDLGFSGSDTVAKLFIGATQMEAGVYGPSATSIPQIISTTGTGTLTVTSGPPAGGYSSWASVNGAGVNLNGDHDHDGVPNGVEYFIGGPNGNTSGFTAVPGVTDTAGTLSVTWTRSADYTGTYGTDFVVETSATLAAPWTPEPAAPDPGFTVTFPSETEVKYTFPAGTRNFSRLKVTGP